jgi:hypothetical protein
MVALADTAPRKRAGPKGAKEPPAKRGVHERAGPATWPERPRSTSIGRQRPRPRGRDALGEPLGPARAERIAGLEHARAVSYARVEALREQLAASCMGAEPP